NSSFTIASPGAGDSGSYDVVITNQCGSATSAAATLSATDTEPPTISCPGNVTVSCAADIPPADTHTVVASDNCSAVTVIQVGDVSDGLTCPETITRTYKAIDASSNEATCVQIITVHNQTAPQLTCPADVQVECDASTDPSNTGTATATDTCGGVPAITFS